jgi:hypothetical protein
MIAVGDGRTHRHDIHSRASPHVSGSSLLDEEPPRRRSCHQHRERGRHAAGDTKKLAAVYPADLAATMSEVAGASIAWQSTGLAKELSGHLRVPDAKTMLKFGFAHYAKKRAEFPFPSNLDVVPHC